jgi:hypothetical protein
VLTLLSSCSLLPTYGERRLLSSFRISGFSPLAKPGTLKGGTALTETPIMQFTTHSTTLICISLLADIGKM